VSLRSEKFPLIFSLAGFYTNHRKKYLLCSVWGGLGVCRRNPPKKCLMELVLFQFDNMRYNWLLFPWNSEKKYFLRESSRFREIFMMKTIRKMAE